PGRLVQEQPRRIDVLPKCSHLEVLEYPRPSVCGAGSQGALVLDRREVLPQTDRGVQRRRRCRLVRAHFVQKRWRVLLLALRPATHLAVSLLNGFLLKRGEEVVLLPLACQRLLALLAFHDRPVFRTFVAGTLWPEFSEERAAACLRSTLWRLHRPAGDAVAAT